MKVKLTSVQRYTTDKDNQPLKTKDGRPYTRITIRCAEYGDKFLSGFDNFQSQNWKQGDTVDIEVEQKGEYLNFKIPNKFEKLENEITSLKLRITNLEKKVLPPVKEVPYPAGEPDEVPF